MQRSLLVSFGELSEVAFLGRLEAIVSKLSRSPATEFFPSPWMLGDEPWSLAELIGEVQGYTQLYSEAAHGSRQKIEARKARRVALTARLKLLAKFLEARATGDEAKLHATGFGLARVRSGPTSNLPPAPEELRLRHGGLEGMLVARCRGVRGSKGYELQVCAGNADVEANWRLVGVMANPRRMEIRGLTPGVLYSVRVRALNHVGPGPWSGIAQLRAD